MALDHTLVTSAAQFRAMLELLDHGDGRRGGILPYPVGPHFTDAELDRFVGQSMIGALRMAYVMLDRMTDAERCVCVKRVEQEIELDDLAVAACDAGLIIPPCQDRRGRKLSRARWMWAAYLATLKKSERPAAEANRVQLMKRVGEKFERALTPERLERLGLTAAYEARGAQIADPTRCDLNWTPPPIR